MKLSGWQLLVASSLFLAVVAGAETRPQYGGTLRVAVQIAPVSLDPADIGAADTISRRNLTWLMFDTLVTIDSAGSVRPALAATWQSEPGDQRWQFTLRHDVKFHDGTPLTADVVAASLRFANPGWTISANGDSVTIECKSPAANLLSELALPRNAIARRVSGGTIAGTGPFHFSDWQPGKKLTLAAQEDYWDGRAFLDSIVVELGKSSREQLTELELGKVDESEFYLQRALNLSPKSAEALQTMANLYNTIGEVEKARSLFDELARTNAVVEDDTDTLEHISRITRKKRRR